MKESQPCWGGVYIYKLSNFDTMESTSANAISAVQTDGSTPPASALGDFVCVIAHRITLFYPLSFPYLEH